MSSGLEPLDPALYRETVRRAIAEDIGWGDLTTDAIVPADLKAGGSLVAGDRCVVAGLDVAAEVFRQLDPGVRFETRIQDGQGAQAGDLVAELVGLATAMLTAERTALGFLERLSAIATITRAYVDRAGGRLEVLDTRHTTPTLRVLEKYAVRAGGGRNHRLTLDEELRVTDAHTRLAGGLELALDRLRAKDHELPVEVEIGNLEMLDRALAAGVTRIRAVGLDTGDLREAARRARGRAELEAGGAVTIGSLDDLARAGIAQVAVDRLTRAAPGVGFTLEVRPL